VKTGDIVVLKSDELYKKYGNKPLDYYIVIDIADNIATIHNPVNNATVHCLCQELNTITDPKQ
tara:strand:+ start:288 stop:476 length:189 start_codon:yes stop_codon:yes gene_type:complete